MPKKALRKSFIKRSKEKSAYVIVHPDDFALTHGNSKISPIQYKQRLIYKINQLIYNNVSVIVLNLEQNTLHPPSFLSKFQGKIEIIPSFSNDNTESQVLRLKEKLIFIRGLKRVIFTGGWINACFKHTLSQTIKTDQKIFPVENLTKTFQGSIVFKKYTKKVWVEVDHEYLF